MWAHFTYETTKKPAKADWCTPWGMLKRVVRSLAYFPWVSSLNDFTTRVDTTPLLLCDIPSLCTVDCLSSKHHRAKTRASCSHNQGVLGDFYNSMETSAWGMSVISQRVGKLPDSVSTGISTVTLLLKKKKEEENKEKRNIMWRPPEGIIELDRLKTFGPFFKGSEAEMQTRWTSGFQKKYSHPFMEGALGRSKTYCRSPRGKGVHQQEGQYSVYISVSLPYNQNI